MAKIGVHLCAVRSANSLTMIVVTFCKWVVLFKSNSVLMHPAKIEKGLTISAMLSSYTVVISGFLRVLVRTTTVINVVTDLETVRFVLNGLATHLESSIKVVLIGRTLQVHQ